MLKGMLRLSSRSSGFGRSVDPEVAKEKSGQALPFKAPGDVRKQKVDVPMQDLSIEVRTDTYVTRSEYTNRTWEISLSEKLHQPE